MNAIQGWRRLVKSFGCAFRGLVSVIRSEKNFRIHLFAVFMVALLGWFFRVSSSECLALVLCCGAVLAAEVMNTSIEYLADAIHPERDPAVGRAKDAAAGAVLIAALAAVAVGAIVFLPKIWEWLQKIQESSG